MTRPARSTNDPFETLVELTAAAVSRRPPPDYVYEPAGPGVVGRVAGLLHRIHFPTPYSHMEAANDRYAEKCKNLEQYYY